tara:strand:- start:343 stop:1290 length:948 start_codon:yes stop_codon:yes gene_type:complete
MLHVDGGNNSVGIGVLGSSSATLTVDGQTGGNITHFTAGGAYGGYRQKRDAVLGNGTMHFTPDTVPGSGTADWYTYFANYVSGSGTTRHSVKIGHALTVDGVLYGAGGAVFNDSGADVDFRVESDTNANMFVVDASADAVNIGNLKIAVYASDTNSGYIVDGGNVGIRFSQPGVDDIVPCTTAGADRDNSINFGAAGARWGTIFAGTGTINTSDQNEKQDVAELSEAEQRVAVAAKGLLRKFRWKDSVAEKGDAARTHVGIMAQDLQAAFAAEGLDASDYAMWCSDTWTDKETGEEHTRMGVRYSELLAFIISAI